MVLQLGAFDLVDPISTGGMGTVWSATHRATERIVAIKVISKSSDTIYVDSFEREVQTIAKLNHPNIVAVYDFGRVPKKTAEKSGGQLKPNSPWFAMEYAGHGSLATLGPVQNWETLRTILLDILDALAHAHARTVIHRDIKPGNVMLGESPEGLVCKLTDFGIAHISQGPQATHEVFASAAGTPWYMAPEQIDSRWRDYGPWTDLYAVGCLAFRLITGKTPFDSASPIEVARQHLYEQPPPLEIPFDCPDGLTQWVAKLLNKHFLYRFRRAADAAWVLRQIDPSPIHRLQLAGSIRVDDEFSTIDVNEDTLVHDPDSERSSATLTSAPPVTGLFSLPVMIDPIQFSVPPIPERWDYNYQPNLHALSGVGLNLFGLRDLPFVGRTYERDLLWSDFRDTAVERSARAVLITGDPGVGKTRLAYWIAQRAHELGGASVSRARHQPRADRADELDTMFRRSLECNGLDFDRAFNRVLGMLPFYSSRSSEEYAQDAAAITQLMFPGQVPKSPKIPRIRGVGPTDRYEWARAILYHMSSLRPLIVILDDVQWAHGAIEFAEYVLDAQEKKPSPITFLITSRRSIHSRRVLEATALERLRKRPDVREVRLESLEHEEHRAFLREGLMLAPESVDKMAQASANPLYAIQLFGDWTERDALTSTPSGFVVDVDEPLPENLDGAWIQRIETALAQLDDPIAAKRSLEVAALFGGFVANGEWYEVCRSLGITIDDVLIFRLQTRGLANLTERGWSFQHELLREALESNALKHDYGLDAHRAIAQMLEGRDDTVSLLRRTTHLSDAGETTSAIDVLLDAVRSMLDAGEIVRPIAELTRAADLWGRLVDEKTSQPLRVKIERFRCEAYIKSGEVAELSRSATYVLDHGSERRDLAYGGWALGLACSMLGQDETALECWEPALEHALASEDLEVEARLRRSAGWVAIRSGDSGEEAEGNLLKAQTLFDQIGATVESALALTMLGELESLRGNTEKALYLLQQCQTVLKNEEDLNGLAHATILLAEIHRREGRLDDADALYADALVATRRAGHLNQFLCLINLGYVALERRDALNAERYFKLAGQGFRNANQEMYLFHTEVGLVASHALAGDALTFEQTLARVESAASRDLSDSDGGRCMEIAGDAWLEHPEFAERCFRTALLLTPTNDVEQTNRISQKLDRIY